MITGRPPKPPALKALEGNKGKRDLSKENLVDFEAADPGCPAWLSDKAKIEWNRMAPFLVENGLLTAAYRMAFAIYCTASAEVEDLEIKIATVPDIELRIAKGYINARDKMWKQMRNYLQLFGLSPADQMRIKGIEKPKKSKLELFLTRNKKPA